MKNLFTKKLPSPQKFLAFFSKVFSSQKENTMTKSLMGKKFLVGSFFVFGLFFAQGSQAATLPVGDISTCGTLQAAGIYSLTQNISSVSGTCFIVTSNGVTITSSSTAPGAPFTITAAGGNTSYAITATSSGAAYGTTTIQNLTFSGFGGGGINASGNSNGGAGAAVVVASSTLGTATSTSIGYINTQGGGVGNVSYIGGAVSVTNSIVGNITTTPGLNATSSSISGVVTITNSTAGNIITDGSPGSQGHCSQGGNITVASSNTGNISAQGGAGGGGASGGDISVATSTVGTVNASEHGNDSTYVANGGKITITNSSTKDLTSYGGDSSSAPASGGNITVSYSTVSGVISASDNGYINSVSGSGGSINIISSVFATTTSGGGSCSTSTTGCRGGAGGSITITNSTSTGLISSTGGNGSPTNSGYSSAQVAGGAGGSITITSSNVATTTSQGGDGFPTGGFNVNVGNGGSGGTITISTSTVSAINSLGGNGGSDQGGSNNTAGNGGNAGVINVTNSTITGLITAKYGIGGTKASGGSGSAGVIGLGATTTIATSTTASITSTGVGSAIVITGTNVNISNNTYTASSTSVTNTGTFTTTGTVLSATNLSVTNNGTTTNFGAFAGGAFPLLPGTINSCGTILVSGTYTLGQSLTGVSGTCFIVQANNVTIGSSTAPFTITATSSNTSYAITATSTGAAYGTTTVNNLTFSGFGGGGINANGTTAGAGGNVSIATSTMGAITSVGVGTAAVSGNINISNSNTGAVTASGGFGAAAANGGVGGTINITASSTVTGAVTASGGGTVGGTSGAGGTISITASSTVTGAITASGGTTTGGTSGAGGTISITASSTVTGAVTANGGFATFSAGGAGGTINITTSSTVTGSVTASGGNGSSGAGAGVGGNINISNSNTGAVTANGGSGVNFGNSPTGGAGGTITITSSTVATTTSQGGMGTTNGIGVGSVGGAGGSITFTNATSTGTINSLGGNGGDALASNSNGGAGGAASAITVNTSSIAGLISATPGAGGVKTGTGTVGARGAGATTTIATSTTASITNTGVGSAIVITGTNLNLSNNTYTASSTSLTYSGTLTTASTILSALNSFTVNGPGNLPGSLGSFVGGAFPLIPGNISSCGTIYFANTYTLTGNSTSNCDVQKSGATIAGAGGGAQKILTGNITANNFGVTISNLTVTGAVSTTGATPGALTVNNASNLQGTVNVTGVLNGDGSSSVGNTTINSGASVATSSVAFVGDVLNNGTINSGNTVAGKITNNNIINTGAGSFIFNASSTNSGTVNGNAIFNASSTNYLTATTSLGTITGNATFAMYTADGNGAVSFGGTTAFGGTGNVTGTVNASGTVPITSWIFNASSTNTGTLKGNAVFNNTSSNKGTVQGNATFNNTSTNTGTVTGNSDVYSPVSRPLGGTTNGTVIYHNYPGLYFNDSAAGHGTAGKWNDLLNWWTDASSTIHAPVLPTAGDDVTILVGNITTATSSTAYANTFNFQGTTTNSITIWPTATTTDAVLFTASSTNGASGTVHGNATFYGPGTDNLGSVTGYITRQYGSPIAITGTIIHNFTYVTVQALNSAVVDLTNATYNLTNYFFQALNNASFIWAAVSGGNGGVGAPVVTITTTTLESNAKWAPSIDWGNGTACQYKIDSGTYSSVACANNGSNIPRPSAGTHTLYVKSTNGSNITEKSTTFTYDNTLPVSTDCSAPLDEVSRPYYYLTSNVGNCTATVSTTLRGDDNGGGHFYTAGNITGSSTNIILQNITATGSISSFNNITVASSTLSGAIIVNGTFTSDNKSTFGNTTIASGGIVNSGNFVGTLTNSVGGTITNSTTTPVTVALSTTNNGNITGGFVFNATSTNAGTVTGTTTLNGTSINQNIINGNTTINNSAINSGTINGNLTFGNLTSTNGAVTFSGATSFTGTNINLGSNTVSGNIYDHLGNQITRWIFTGTSANIGSLKGDAFFNGTSTNVGSVYGNAYFSDAGANFGTVSGSINVYANVITPFTGATTYHSYPNAPSFRNISGDNDWNNLSNWFTDTTFALPLGRLPNANENIVLFASTTLPTDITNNVFIAVSSTTLDGAGHTLNGKISGNGAYGGHDAYNFNIQNITVTGTTSAIGGDGITHVIDGGKGGIINVATSSTWVIAVNGGDPTDQNGGDAGVINVYNSYALQENTPLLAIGGDSHGCGFGGSGGNISLIDSSGYQLVTDVGADSTLNCTPGPAPTRSTGRVSVVGTYTSPAQRAAALAAKNAPRPSASGVSRTYIAPYNPLAQSITLPVNQLKPLVLTKLPVFGDTGAKGTFSFLQPLSNFLFVPLSTSTSPALQTFLDDHNIKTLQALVSLKLKPLVLPVPPPLGLFTVTASSLSVQTSFGKTIPSSSNLKTTLTSDSTHNLLELVSVLPNTTLTITLKGAKTGTYNGTPITFTNGFATITVPKKAVRYYLTSPDASIPLAIDVKGTKVVVVPSPSTPTPPVSIPIITPIVNTITNWFSSWFH